MRFKSFEETNIEGLIILEPQKHLDRRGIFMELHNQDAFDNSDLNGLNFVQDNLSVSKKNVLRGLHTQKNNPQGKLVTCIKGSVFDAAVDIRPQSKTFGEVFFITLDDLSFKQLYIPPGIAHGFLALSQEAVFHYKCTDFYSPTDQFGIIWNDGDCSIPWPVRQPILSKKDLSLPTMKEFLSE